MKKYKLNNNNFNILDFLGDMFIRAILFLAGPVALVAPLISDWKNDNPVLSLIITIIWLVVEYTTVERFYMVDVVKEEKNVEDKEVTEYLKKWSKDENR